MDLDAEFASFMSELKEVEETVAAQQAEAPPPLAPPPVRPPPQASDANACAAPTVCSCRRGLWCPSSAVTQAHHTSTNNNCAGLLVHHIT